MLASESLQFGLMIGCHGVFYLVDPIPPLSVSTVACFPVWSGRCQERLRSGSFTRRPNERTKAALPAFILLLMTATASTPRQWLKKDDGAGALKEQLHFTQN